MSFTACVVSVEDSVHLVRRKNLARAERLMTRARDVWLLAKSLGCLSLKAFPGNGNRDKKQNVHVHARRAKIRERY